MARRALANNNFATNNDGKFCDPIFPPDQSSLCFDPSNPKLDPDVKAFVSQVKVCEIYINNIFIGISIWNYPMVKYVLNGIFV